MFTRGEDGTVLHRAASENHCRSFVTLEALYPLALHLYHRCSSDYIIISVFNMRCRALVGISSDLDYFA